MLEVFKLLNEYITVKYAVNGLHVVPQTLMLVSSTTRPVLSCVWDFPSVHSGLAYATASIVVHEITPILLMATTSLCSLCTLYKHSKMRPTLQNANIIKRVPAEKRAATVRKRIGR